MATSLAATRSDATRLLGGTYCWSVRCKAAIFPTEANMGFGRGVLLWILGVPIPIIILLALFWHH